jgi:biofilm PGA synthesis N-glycosyltransferase PgaC
MLTWLIIFTISCFIVFYNYAGYAILVYLFNKLKKNNYHPRMPEDSRNPATGPADTTPVNPATGPADTTPFYPTVSFIVAAYNEEDCISQKIINSLEQDYPKDRLEILFITDGSSDRTPEIVLQYPAVRLLHLPERNGKSAALNRAVRETKQDILIFSDANTILNPDATKNIVRHYRNHRTGGVAGEKKVLSASPSNEVGAGEGLYWKYESFLKQLDSDFYSVVGAAGELFSLRRDLYEQLPHTVILDDFVLSLKTAGKGYPIRYEPEAYAMELPSFSLKDEEKRKVRIAAGGFQAIGMLLPLLAFWKNPRLSFLYISHRVLRWTLSPLCFILAFISNAVLAFFDPGIIPKIFFTGQLLFYGTAILASLLPALQTRSKLARLTYYFVFMNVSVIRGFFRFLRRKQAGTWERSRRAQFPMPE